MNYLQIKFTFIKQDAKGGNTTIKGPIMT